jgi:hypothetical protein
MLYFQLLNPYIQYFTQKAPKYPVELVLVLFETLVKPQEKMGWQLFIIGRFKETVS